jgi:hypothetical protein
MWSNCADLDEWAFLPSGNAQLTCQAKRECSRYFVVLKFSRAHKRYERQGLLVEEQGLEQARQKLGVHCQEWFHDLTDTVTVFSGEISEIQLI